MTTMREYRCEGCGIVDTRPIHAAIRNSQFIAGIQKQRKPPALGISAVKPTPRCTSADGSIRYARRPNPISTFPRQRDETAIAKRTRESYRLWPSVLTNCLATTKASGTMSSEVEREFEGIGLGVARRDPLENSCNGSGKRPRGRDEKPNQSVDGRLHGS
jgi:hypothetical protein